MKLLVTGATGFVGTWLTKYLLDRGHDVRVLSRSGKIEFPFDSSRVETFRGDVTDKSSVRRACANVQSIFHLAGVVGYSKAMREQMVATNVVGTANVIEACREAGCTRLVHMSSVVAVGASFDGKRPLDETSEFNLHHLDLGYFETKHRAEQLVKAAAQAKEIDAVMVNPSTIYGPGDATKGSRSTQLKVARGKFPFYTSGGVNVIHIDDAVKAIYRAWEVGRAGERYILAGENIRIQKLFELVAGAAGVKAPTVYLPNPVVKALGKVGDFLERHGKKGPINTENAWASILFHWFDNGKARKELGLDPKPADVAIRESVNWMKIQHMLE